MKFSRSFISILAAATFSVVLMTGTAFAQSTTSSIRVVVTNESGATISGVGIKVTHMPTGRTRTADTNSNGVATARGLAVGGPYEVTVVGGGDYAADVQQNIFAKLDQTEVVDIVARAIIEEVVVTAKAPTGQLAVGIGRSFDRARIDATPSVSRDFVNAGPRKTTRISTWNTAWA
jgi:hypothetical protein